MPKNGNGNGNEELLIRPDQQKVSPLPEIITMNRDSSSDCFLVAACDGIWDVVTNDECSDMIAQIFKEGEDNLGLVAEEVS
jgi:serine/threonine protein phosphatase PrpC